MTTPPLPQKSAASALFQDRSFAWMMTGGFISMLGDQFTLVALPWAVLLLTGDTAVLGTVIAMIAVPRAAFLLIGGAVVDRWTPKAVMMVTKVLNAVLLGLLAALVGASALTLPMLYALALAIGLATAFSVPASTAMLPQVVAASQLQAANGLMLAMRQVTFFLGPLLAGLVVATGSDARGLAWAFGLDALSFAVTLWTLSQVKVRPLQVLGRQSLMASMVEGIRHCWRDVPLRSCLLYWSALALLILGPVHIALPVLAARAPTLGAAAFGIMLGAHGAGTLLGMALAGLRPHWRLGTLGTTMLAVDAAVGLLFMPLGSVQQAWQGAVLLLVSGVLGGFMHVAVFSWIQHRVPPTMLGRAMGLFMFIFMGLVPLSAAATGWLMRDLALQALFAGCGGALVMLAALAYALTPVRGLRDRPAAAT
jgi:MFS family permease